MQAQHTVTEATTATGITSWGECCAFGLNYLIGVGGGVGAALLALVGTRMAWDPGKLDVINDWMESAFGALIE